MKTGYKCPECSADLETYDGFLDCIPCGLTIKLVNGKLEMATIDDINAYWTNRHHEEPYEDNL